VIRVATVAAAVVLSLGASTATAATPESAPAMDAPLARTPAGMAARLTATTGALRRAIDRWSARDRASHREPPLDVTLHALYQQRMYRFLGRRDRFARATVRRLPRTAAAHARDVIAARRALTRLSPPSSTARVRVGPAAPAAHLSRWYRQAQRRFGVRWQLLAAVNLVETAFGRMRNASVAGARGPMQFLPSTWRIYGLGGDIDDPRDAIMGAANYLRASGALADERRALYAYNHSWLYVEAVRRYARRMQVDARDYLAFYSWQVIVRMPAGDRRLTGPGLPTRG
jgi:membrane-bound lytic murein transglycosylase B